MTTIVHRTPGLLDVRSFTVMGMSAKPGTGHPIGQFGTGLKYSIAGLLRSGAAVSIWIGRDHWQFELSEEEFRGSTFGRIHAWVRTWGGLRRRRVELPFTTMLGPHWTWWMWLRELHSNTLDEDGETLQTGPSQKDRDMGIDLFWLTQNDQIVMPTDDTTLVVITHPEYAAAWEARAEVFLPGATALADAGTSILQVLPGPSTRVFYRGVRALDTRLPTLRTWNILVGTPLTEDRTMPEFWARHHLGIWLVRDATDEGLIREVLEAEEDCWEHELELPHHIRPSPHFAAASSRVHGRRGARLTSYTSVWTPPPLPDERPFWERRGHLWQIDDGQILDERGRPLLARAAGILDDDWRQIAGLVIAAAREPAAPAPPPPVLRPMLVGDLYTQLDHLFETQWPEGDDFDARKITVCSECGRVYQDGDEYEYCSGPAWMQSDTPIRDMVEAAHPDIQLLYEPVVVGDDDDFPF